MTATDNDGSSICDKDVKMIVRTAPALEPRHSLRQLT